MADNVAITAGSGTNIAADDVSSVFYQKMKLDAGGDGVSVPLIAGVQTTANSLPIAIASDQSAVPTKGSSVASSATWDGSTALNTALTIVATGIPYAVVAVKKTGTISTGGLAFEVDDGTGAWATTLAEPVVIGTTGTLSNSTVTLSALGSSLTLYIVYSLGLPSVRVRLSSSQITGGGSLAISITGSTNAAAVPLSMVVQQTTGSNLIAQVTNAGTFLVQASVGAAAGSIGKSEDAVSNDSDVGVPALAVRKATPANTSDADGDYEFFQISAGRLWTSSVDVGDIAHDGVNSGNPVQIGVQAISHGTNPSAVSSADRTKVYANVAGIPFVIGGHPNVLTLKHTTITTAVTDAKIITISTGSKIVVTRLTVTLDNASTVFPTFLIGFAATNTPTTTGVLAAHGGIPAGGGFTIGDGSGILGVGADGDDLIVTTTGNATGNGLQITVSYYTVDS